MNLKEKMMETMMGSMSAEERKEMMEKIMETFFASMSPEEKQDMMKNMMPKMMEMMMGKGGSMMSMMGSMMGGKGPMAEMMKCCDDSGEESEGGFNPMEMCKQMMSSMRQSSEIATFATPEIRSLFEDWVRQIEDEIEQYIDKNVSCQPDILASHFKISKESVLYILSRLAQKGNISINVEKKSST
ncbi:MAG: hypothetical protein ABSB78_12020 [Bacteroidota bacterium]